MNNIFEKGTRDNVKFSTSKGNVGIPDLWTYNEITLANLGKSLKAELKPLVEEDDEFSITPAKTSKEAEVLKLKIAIVKHILEVKISEKRAKNEAHALESRKQELRELIAIKKGEADKGKALEDLEKELAELG